MSFVFLTLSQVFQGAFKYNQPKTLNEDEMLSSIHNKLQNRHIQVVTDHRSAHLQTKSATEFVKWSNINARKKKSLPQNQVQLMPCHHLIFHFHKIMSCPPSWTKVENTKYEIDNWFNMKAITHNNNSQLKLKTISACLATGIEQGIDPIIFIHPQQAQRIIR